MGINAKLAPPVVAAITLRLLEAPSIVNDKHSKKGTCSCSNGEGLLSTSMQASKAIGSPEAEKSCTQGIATEDRNPFITDLEDVPMDEDSDTFVYPSSSACSAFIISSD